MTFLRMGGASVLPPSCLYPGARLRVRGPVRPLPGDHIVALGGAATFGKGAVRPWPHLLEAATGRAVANLGAVGAGPEAYLRDPALLRACDLARAVVMEVPGAEGLCNPFYRVHPRRNDRVIEVHRPLRALYPELDFHEVGFARALLERLRLCDPDRLAVVTEALQAAWAARMGDLLRRISAMTPVTLLWLGNAPVADGAVTGDKVAPPLVTRDMLEGLEQHGVERVAALVPQPSPTGAPGLPTQAVHDAAAEALAAIWAAARGGNSAPPNRAAG